MSAITYARLKKFAPSLNLNVQRALMVDNADEILINAGIKSAVILQHFMGQIYVETGGLRFMEEDLHYSASRLMKVFPHYFHDFASAIEVAGNPEKTANVVYGGRMGNNLEGDGYKYRGSGLLDITGKYNNKKIAAITGIDLVNHPELSRGPDALRVAAAIWDALGCNAPAERDDVRAVSMIINGGTNGLNERIDATDRASEIFTDDPSSDTAPASLLTSAPIVVSTANSKITTMQGKQLQQKLKEKNFSPGEIDGKLQGPKTIGAIATLQAQQGLPVTGIVDDDTEDAIQNAPSLEVSESRKNETAESLRAKGSTTILAADKSISNSRGIIASGASLFGAGSIASISTINDQVDQLKRLTDHVPNFAEKAQFFITNSWPFLFLVVIGLVLIYFAYRIFHSSHIIINERVRKSASGEDMSH